MGGEGGWLKEVEQTKQLLYAVLQRCTSKEHPVLKVKVLETFQEFAVSIFEPVSLVNDHNTPLDVLKLTLISCGMKELYIPLGNYSFADTNT